jgi:hypothetical protein
MATKPQVPSRHNENIFGIVGACTEALEAIGQREAARQLAAKVFKAEDYEHAVKLCEEYVEFV